MTSSSGARSGEPIDPLAARAAAVPAAGGAGAAPDAAGKYPVEPKVIAGAGGAGAGAVVGQFIVYLLDVLLYTPGRSIGDKVPTIVEALVTVLVAALGAWLAGYRAPHQQRAGKHAAPTTRP